MVKVIYASVTGNTEKVAKYIVDKIQGSQKVDEVEMISSDSVDTSVFTPENIYVIATSTWNIGQMNQYMEELYAQLESAELSGVKMAFVGLGDKVYGEENFCKSMKDFRERSLDKGATEIGAPLEIDGDPDDMKAIGLDSWLDQFISSLG